MKTPTFFRSVLLGAVVVGSALLPGLAVAQPIFAPRPMYRVRMAPPPMRVEVTPVAPSPRHVWVAGHWMWRGNRYIWVNGHYRMAPRPGHSWVQSRWVNEGGQWVFYDGHWQNGPAPVVMAPPQPVYQPPPQPVYQPPPQPVYQPPQPVYQPPPPVVVAAPQPVYQPPPQPVYQPPQPIDVQMEAPPPPPQYEVEPMAPSAQHAWIPGHWAWQPGQGHVWVRGHHEIRQVGRTWQPAHWVRWGRHWRYTPGHWR